ncbi:hypothetical protein Axi01nite_20620 [Actinoplanes xinjiangensis]|nr:hypothetical protein Axi01nite_20620 [Actinoplanes xinjiangensis]
MGAPVASFARNGRAVGKTARATRRCGREMAQARVDTGREKAPTASRRGREPTRARGTSRGEPPRARDGAGAKWHERGPGAEPGVRKHDDGGRDRPPFVGSRIRAGSAGSAMPLRALAPAVLETFEEAAALATLAGAP